MHIGILDDYTRVVPELKCLAKMSGHRVSVWHDREHDVGRLAERLKDVDALIPIRERTRITGELIARLPNLKIVTLTGPSLHVDVEACTRHGVLFCNGRPGQTYGTAELTWGLALAAMRRIPQEVARLKAGSWQGSTGTVLHGRTLGILGYGRIGRIVAGYGRAFGMEVLVWSRESGRAAAAADGHEVARSQRALFQQSDVLSLHVKLVPETKGLVTAADLAAMKPTSVLVNTSRSGLIEPGALVAALEAGRPGSAAVDVYDREPIFGAEDPLLHLDNAVCTPHLGFVERDGLESYFSAQFDRILAFAACNPIDVQNPEVLDRPFRRAAG
ncbi:D-2-hydroxyacid dehydrogenase family protein [Propylenella binzhouense]|uniref:D-2-hydroxyacid dehydrogenase family protein n=1 Tax=Propylenella binzhouense TaxID=2555902 RepID=A0A964T3S7_9HYPH|nr:D-2-hydroxyacid dehydrogenase family protein [Propylenella binzhouense]MYZ47680.1 D-2-hydroxyacid dehydrogenase family protein [Propylenella binzhouense]